MYLHEFDKMYNLDWIKLEVTNHIYFARCGDFQLYCIRHKVPLYDIYDVTNDNYPLKIATAVNQDKFLRKLSQLNIS